MEYSNFFPYLVSRVVNLRLDKSGRAGPFRPANLSGLGRAGPVGPEFQLGRAVQAQNFCGPGRFLPIFREDFADIPPFF